MILSNETNSIVSWETMRRYGLLYIDPPWKQQQAGKKNVRPKSSGGVFSYQIISLEEIKYHIKKVTSHTEENAVLFLWTIDKYLFEAQKIAEDLGWKLHARMIWNKVTGIPAAFTIRYGHEYLLYMYKGKLIPIATEERGKIHSVFVEQVKRHSQKPEIAYQIIERLYPNLIKLEIYARNQREGWDSFGNELPVEASQISSSTKLQDTLRGFL